MPVITPRTQAEAAEQTQMIREGLQVHDAECCSSSAPCTMRVGMQAVLDQLTATVTAPAPRVHGEDLTPRGNGGGYGRVGSAASRPNRKLDAASDAQKGMIRKLAANKAITEYKGVELETFLSIMLRNQVDEAKDFMWNAPWPNAKPEAAVTATKREAAEPGMYRKDGVVYKVQFAVHGSGLPYAKKLVRDGDEWFFVKATGAQFQLTSEHRLTVEDAKEFGDLYGICIRCAATLTDEVSIARGMGPTCAGKI